MRELYNGIEITEEMFENFDYDERLSEEGGYTNYSYWKSTFRTFFKSRLSIFLVLLILLLVVFSFTYPLVYKTDPNQVTLVMEDWNAKSSP